MESIESGHPAASEIALQPAAGAGLYPEPEWITRAADEFGWAWARQNWQRASRVHGAWFDVAKADAVVEAFPGWFTLTTLRFAGKPFRLQFWQEVIVRLLVGWKAPNEILDPETLRPIVVHVRVFQELRLWVPRKNGKSEFFAALALYFWYYEGSYRGTGFVFAHDEAQAREVFDKMGDMVGNSPTMKKAVRVLNRQLWVQKIKAPFRLMPGKAKGKQGRAPAVTVGDEMEEWVSRALADALRQGEGAQLQPMRLYAGTAGLKTQVVGRELYQESEKLLDGRLDDPSVMVVIFAAGEEEDWKDNNIIKRVNPSIGLSPTMKFLLSEKAKALESPRAEAEFRRYHLNQWIEDLVRWIPIKTWDACCEDKDAWRVWGDETADGRIAAGRSCVMSFDSTQNFDFAQICWRFDPEKPGEKPKLLWKFFLPVATIAARGRAENKINDFDFWVKSGLLVAIPGEVFELRYAIAEVRKSMQRWNVRKIGYDPFQAAPFYSELVNPQTEDRALPEDLFAVLRFGTKTLGPPTKEFERKILGGEIDHGGNPIARWMMTHCHVRFDENMNFVPAKKRSVQSIDGIVGAVMTEAMAMALPDTTIVTIPDNYRISA
ncbi:MAG: terminase [Anaerolineaceae bacterium]|nr:MAG: terminase [Anaerolineaceae bacterium]